MNRNRISILKSMLKITTGLFFSSFGAHLAIRANIGVNPWDTLNLGISGSLGILYGTASITVSVIVLTLDILMKEPIGLGMLLDAFLVGKFIDFFNWLDLFQLPQHWLVGILVMTASMTMSGIAQVFYMGSGLGCGPRDTLMVALCKRFSRIPVGGILAIMMVIVLLAGWLLGGPIGIGTLYSVLCAGPITQAVYRSLRFDPAAITHQNLLTSLRILLTGKAPQEDPPEGSQENSQAEETV